ncbi:hypothetical protein HMPREF3291_18750 [Bacillus sp. HMSC76G11]|nr:hypothetical protein HMPREF3291_18750 [Bacillus sp. HMSC76G11]
MKLNSITVKLGGTIMVLFLVVLFPMVYTIDQLFTGFYFNQQQEQINHFASKYTETIKDVEDESSYHMFEMMSDISNTDLFVFNKEGRILKSTGIMDFKEDNEVNEEILSPILDKKDLKMEYSDKGTDNRYLIAAKPIIIKNEVNGGLVVVSNMDSINSSVEQVRSWLAVSVIGSLLIAVGFIFFLSRKLSAPLLQMEHATREIAKGKLMTKLIHTSQDEIGSLAKAITELGEELEEYRTNRREFFANISHELRTPISYIKGYAEVITKGLYKGEKEKQLYLEIITDEASRLTSLINDLFELAKMEEGKLDLHFEWLDISDIISSSVKKVYLRAKEKGIKLEMDIPRKCPLVFTDGRRLEQVLINLLENSIRYSSQENQGIGITLKVHKQFIDIIIRDNGIGIPSEDLPYIFERFYRVEKSRARSSGGTGLGLAIVKNLIELMKGEIRVSSTVGKGTFFTITLPLDREPGENR